MNSLKPLIVALSETTPDGAVFQATSDVVIHEQDDKPIGVKSAMLWGGQFVLHHAGEIDWDTMRNLYGEFMSRQMNLR